MKPDKKSVSTHGVTTLKQGTLGFTSTKRTASTTSARGKKPLKASNVPAPIFKKRQSTESSTSASQDDSTSVSQDEDVQVVERGKKDMSAEKAVSSGVLRERLDNIRSNDETLEALEKSGRLQAHHATVRAKMGNLNPSESLDRQGYMPKLRPVHSAGQTKVHEILRVFDLSSKYGPCVGVSRLERWKRAHALGLNPPIEVYDILSTKQACSDPQYSHSVFHDQV